MKKERGSILLSVLLVSAAVVATSLILLQNSSSLSQAYALKSLSASADNLAMTISTVALDPKVCKDGFDLVAGGEDGLSFVDSGGTKIPFNLATVVASGLDVTLPSSYPSGAGRLQYKAGFVFPDTPFKISRIYVQSAAPDTVDPTAMNLSIFASIQPTASNIGLAPRKVADVQVHLDGFGQPSSCAQGSTTSNSIQALCQGMDCNYSVNSAGAPSCDCPVRAVSCTAGTYVASIVGFVPQCSSTTVTRSCASTPNGFLVALDAGGDPICGQVYSCPAGTSSAGLGAAANPPECKCAGAIETWNGTSCVGGVVVNGACGSPPNTGSYADATAANAAGPLCTAGTSSIATLTGSGPWAWTCVGSGAGHTDASCSASVAVGPPTPLCYYVIGSTGCRDFSTDPCVLQTVDRYIPVLSMMSMLCTPAPYTMCGGGSTYTEPIYAGDARVPNCTSYTPSGSLNGVCGSAAGASSATPPVINLCSQGAAGTVADGGTTWTWQCVGYTATASCTAPKGRICDGTIPGEGWITLNSYSIDQSTVSLGTGIPVIESAWSSWRTGQGASVVGLGQYFSTTYAELSPGVMTGVYSGAPLGNVTGTFVAPPASIDATCSSALNGRYGLHAFAHSTGSMQYQEFTYRCNCP